MRNVILFSFTLVLVAIAQSCSSGKERPATAIDTGRDFIRASLDGDFKYAKSLVMEDSINNQLFESYQRFYEKLPADEKANYKAASYEINKLTEQGDTSLLINYSNTYMKKPMEIRVAKKEEQWFVDFKYTYSAQ